MTQRNNRDLNEFTQKMRNERAGGFGAGPWPEADKIGIKPRPAAMHPGNTRPRPGQAAVPPGKHIPCVLGDRILTGLAILSLGMLIVGAMGAYLSNDSQRVATTAPGVPGLSSGFTESTGIRLEELERRMTYLNDNYGQRLHSLEAKVADVIEPYEARLTNVEARLATAGGIDVAHLRELESRLEQFDARTYEARLKTVETRLEQAKAPGDAGLQNTESRPGQKYAAYDARLREIESRMMQIQAPYEHRLQELEQRLIYAYARLDYLSARMESIINDNTTLMEANATVHDNPPAAAPIDNIDPQRFRPAPTTKDTAAAAMAGPPDADTVRTVVPVAETPSNATASSEAPRAATDVAGELPTSGEPAAELPREPVTSAPSPQTVIANTGALQRQDKPVESATDIREDGSRSQSGTGGWVINLASYASEGIASRKLADFKRKGVSAEQVVATVNGKTIYRVRVTGFDNYKAALAQAETIKRQLGLKETWITKQ
jgi:SPOR domain